MTNIRSVSLLNWLRLLGFWVVVDHYHYNDSVTDSDCRGFLGELFRCDSRSCRLVLKCNPTIGWSTVWDWSNRDKKTGQSEVKHFGQDGDINDHHFQQTNVNVCTSNMIVKHRLYNITSFTYIKGRSPQVVRRIKSGLYLYIIKYFIRSNSCNSNKNF